MKEFDYCLCHKARVFAFCPLYPKICRLTIYMQWFCQEFKKQAASRLHAEAHRDFCTLFGDVSANLLPFIEECLAFISWHFLTPQAADFVRDTTMSVVWLLAGQFRSCAQGGTKSSSWLNVLKCSCWLREVSSIHQLGSFFQLLAWIDKDPLKCTGSELLVLRVAGREYRADKVLQGRIFFRIFFT